MNWRYIKGLKQSECFFNDFWASQVALEVKNLPADEGDVRLTSDPWVGKISWRRACNPLQDSCLENPRGRGDWRATVHGSQRVDYNWSELVCTQNDFQVSDRNNDWELDLEPENRVLSQMCCQMVAWSGLITLLYFFLIKQLTCVF